MNSFVYKLLHMKFLAGIFFLLSTISLFGQQIWIDEDFSDWDSYDPVYTDLMGEGPFSEVDFGKVWMSNDENNIYLSFEVGKEINLQDNNTIALYIDTDNNAATGTNVNGIGVEISWRFGLREGAAEFDNISDLIYHNDIKLISLPTVTSDRFEVTIRRNNTIAGKTLAMGDQIRFLLKDEKVGGDSAPNEGGITYEMVVNENNLPTYELHKTSEDLYRFLSYNIHRDDVFTNPAINPFKRILNMIKPDIIAFQEIYDHSAEETLDLVKSAIDNSEDFNWYAAKVDPDIVCVSKYPITSATSIDGNGAFLINVGEREILLINAHPPCCDNNEIRQLEVDNIMAFIRDTKKGSSDISIYADTPIVIAGDMNLVGDNFQLHTLLTGDIMHNFIFGEDFTPDWDGSDMEDAKPFSTGTPVVSTWYNAESSFSPGRLDYIIYSGSVMQLENTYVLYTDALSDEELSANGLLRDDSFTTSDHLPLVADFSFDIIQNTTNESDIIPIFIYPNPTTKTLNIEYSLDTKKVIEISIHDSLGRSLIQKTYHKHSASGPDKISVDIEHIQPGHYFCKLKYDGGMVSLPFVKGK